MSRRNIQSSDLPSSVVTANGTDSYSRSAILTKSDGSRLDIADIVSVKDFGAKGDLKTNLTDITTSSSSAAVSTSTTIFTTADVGKQIDVYGAGGPVAPPTLTLSTATTGGTLTTGTYAYRATIVTTAGESLPSAEVTINIPAGTSTNTVTVSPGSVSGSGVNAMIKIYGRTSGSEQLLATLPAQPHYEASGFTDTGSLTPSGALPSSDQSAGTLSTTIASFVDTHHVTLAAVASQSISGASWQYGTNDGAAIASALASGAQAVFVPNGSYIVDRILSVASGQHFIGSGRYSTILRVQEPGHGSTPTTIVAFNGTTNSSVRSMTLDGARNTAPTVGGNLIYIHPGSSHIVCDDVRYQNANGNAAAIQCLSSNRCFLTNSEIYQCGYGVIVGSNSGYNGDCSLCVVDNWLIETVDWNGIFLTGDIGSNPSPAQIYRHRVSRVTVRGFYDTAIEIGQGCNFCSVQDVKIDGNSYGNNGILVRDNYGTRVEGYEICGVVGWSGGGYGGTGTGFNVLPQYTNYIGNMVVGRGTIDSCSVGMVTSDLFVATITGCFISNSTTHGINITNSKWLSFSSCIAYHNNYHGFYIGSGTGSSLMISFLSCQAIGNSNSSAGSYYGYCVVGTATAYVTFEGCLGDDDRTGASVTQTKTFNQSATSNATLVNIGPSNMAHASVQGYSGSGLVGISTADHRFLQTDSVIQSIPVSYTTSQTLTGINSIYIFKTGTSLTATLPLAAAYGSTGGPLLFIKNLTSTSLTVQTQSTQTIDASGTSATIASGASARFATDGTAWYSV